MTQQAERLAQLEQTGRADQVKRLIRDGWGAHSIHLETGVPVRLINAAFKAEMEA